ncbi:MAG: hypothetical protein EON59_02900 [Alphaproteobacteria bacterium]|nr:MAG: hypothetical protein EON59_02900 [Alphaproteobacteria bacterium]
MRERLNTGTSALQNGDWTAAQYSCYVAKETATNSPYRAQDAYYQARVIGRTCMADAAYKQGNQEFACDWWKQVDYDSLIGLDPREICSRATPPKLAPAVTTAGVNSAEAAPRNMTTTFAEMASLSPLSALANYGFPRWGMTPSEVVAASSGAIIRVAGRAGSEVFNLSMLAEGTLKSGEAMRFYFAKSGERLTLVKVIPRPEVCGALETDLSKIWGTPLVAEHKEWAPGFRTGLTRWRVASGDLVTLAWSLNAGQPDDCHILIQPAATTF